MRLFLKNLKSACCVKKLFKNEITKFFWIPFSAKNSFLNNIDFFIKIDKYTCYSTCYSIQKFY